MAKKLEGNEFRVFRCLINESQNERFEDICIEMTHRPAMSTDEVERAFASLQEKGYAEEFKPEHWKHTPNGYGVRRSLLGEIPDEEAEGPG